MSDLATEMLDAELPDCEACQQSGTLCAECQDVIALLVQFPPGEEGEG